MGGTSTQHQASSFQPKNALATKRGDMIDDDDDEEVKDGIGMDDDEDD